MSMLENIMRGRENKPPCLFIYGQEGVGKSTVGAAAPNPVFVQTEDGLGEIDTAKFPLANTLDEVLKNLAALRDEPHEFKTVALDSADWLERLIRDQVCAESGVRSIEKADGGYGKGCVHALGHWRKAVARLNDLRETRGMIVSKVERLEAPENSAYDRYTPRLHKSAISLLCDWADAVLFATKRFRVSKEQGGGFQGERAIATAIGADGGECVLRTVGSPAGVAKSRFGLPSEIPLSWQAFIVAYATAKVGGNVGKNRDRPASPGLLPAQWAHRGGREMPPHPRRLLALDDVVRALPLPGGHGRRRRATPPKSPPPSSSLSRALTRARDSLIGGPYTPRPTTQP